jgi:DNA-binding MarR family transcriptional regulator/GNAT superfamily N-acetyltransferase
MEIGQQIAILRRFNRSYTQRIGALEDSFLGMGMPLSHERLLFEIGSAPGTVHGLRVRLGLDSGYLSRLLRRLESEGLVALTADPKDRRRRRVDLTRKGRAHWAELEKRSDGRAQRLVGPLTERQRERLTRALAEADLLVRASTVSLDTVAPQSQAAQEAVGRYFTEIGRRFGYVETGQSEKDAEQLLPPHGAFVVAVGDGEPVACGGVQTIGCGVGEIKRMWVRDDWRGAGLGSRLLRHLEGIARSLGRRIVRLDSNAALSEAISMYERAGYARIARYNDNPFATDFFEKLL